MDTKEHPQVYAKLRELRRSRGLSVSELAEAMGENPQKVGRIERGKRSLTIDYLLKISKAFSIPTETLFAAPEEEKIGPQRFSTNTLNLIVLLVEDICSLSMKDFTSQQKASLISKLYEQTLKISEENRSQYIGTLTESLKLISETL